MPENEQAREHTLQMLPWVRIDEPLTLFGFQLVPWLRRGPSIDVEPALLARVARICSMYRDQRGKRLKGMTLALRAGDRGLARLSDDELERIGWLRFALAVASLASRRFFRSGDGYCNAAHFAMYGQGFTDAAHVAVTARRRDGRTLGGWPIERVRISCAPNAPPILLCHGQGHAPAEARIDIELVRLLERIADRRDDFARCVRASIDFYLTGNSDAEFESHDHDVQLLVFAIESLLRFGRVLWSAEDFAHAVEGALGLSPSDNSWKDAPRWQELAAELAAMASPLDYPGGVKLADIDAYMTERKRGFTIVGLWAFEAYHFRSERSHGDDMARRAWCWNPAEHALFASWLYPLLLRFACATQLGESIAGDLFEDTAKIAARRLRVRSWSTAAGRHGVETCWDRAESHTQNERFAVDLLRSLEANRAREAVAGATSGDGATADAPVT